MPWAPNAALVFGAIIRSPLTCSLPPQIQIRNTNTRIVGILYRSRAPACDGGSTRIPEGRRRRQGKIEAPILPPGRAAVTQEPDMPADEEQQTLGEEIIAWIESECRVPEGALLGQLIQLMPWQRDAILKTYDNPHGTR